MSDNHVVEMPKAVWVMKIVQTIIAVLILAFAAYTVAVIPNSYSGFCIFTAIFSGIALVYYFVSIHSNKQLYNWIALLVLECFSLLWWLIVWALLAASLAIIGYYSTTYNTYGYKRDLAKRLTYGELGAAGILVYVTLALSLINWVLYCVTLGFMSVAIHRHRIAGKPMGYGQPSGFNTASREEKHDMQPMPSGQAASYYAPNNQAPVPAPMHYEHQPQQAPAYPTSPVPANTHEAYGGNRYP